MLARPRPWLQRVLGCLGAIYIPGILGERVTWESFRHPERKTAPLIASALVLAVAMARLGLAGRNMPTPSSRAHKK